MNSTRILVNLSLATVLLAAGATVRAQPGPEYAAIGALDQMHSYYHLSPAEKAFAGEMILRGNWVLREVLAGNYDYTPTVYNANGANPTERPIDRATDTSDLVAVMWALFNQAAMEGQGFEQGSLSVADPKELLRGFLEANLAASRCDADRLGAVSQVTGARHHRIDVLGTLVRGANNLHYTPFSDANPDDSPQAILPARKSSVTFIGIEAGASTKRSIPCVFIQLDDYGSSTLPEALWRRLDDAILSVRRGGQHGVEMVAENLESFGLRACAETVRNPMPLLTWMGDSVESAGRRSGEGLRAVSWYAGDGQLVGWAAAPVRWLGDKLEGGAVQTAETLRNPALPLEWVADRLDDRQMLGARTARHFTRPAVLERSAQVPVPLDRSFAAVDRATPEEWRDAHAVGLGLSGMKTQAEHLLTRLNGGEVPNAPDAGAPQSWHQRERDLRAAILTFLTKLDQSGLGDLDNRQGNEVFLNGVQARIMAQEVDHPLPPTTPHDYVLEISARNTPVDTTENRHFTTVDWLTKTAFTVGNAFWNAAGWAKAAIWNCFSPAQPD